MPKVLNNRTDERPAAAVYVGRPSRLGNPFAIGRDGTREDVIEKYRAHVRGREHEIRRELRGRDLVCWCAPLACHADVLIEIANEGEGTDDAAGAASELGPK